MSSDQTAPNYLPFGGGVFRLTMGLTPLQAEAWLQFDQNFGRDLAAKRRLLETRRDEVFLTLPAADSPARELLLLFAIHLPQHHPELFSRAGDQILNATTGESWNITAPPRHPLDIAGRLVSEDLCLLQADGNHHILVGASLCAPARWRLAEKLGRPLAAIHEPVPGYGEALGEKVEHFFAALKPNRLVCRFNWGITDDPEPFQPTAPAAHVAVTPESAGRLLWLRIERQTLRRLAETGAVVFTIRTYITRLDAAIRTTADARDLAGAIRTRPLATQRYKCIEPVASELLAWLDAVH